MKLHLRNCFVPLLFVGSFYFGADGLSIRRHKQDLSKRIRDNDISFFPIFTKLNSKRPNLKAGKSDVLMTDVSKPRLEAGSSALSGVPGCSECFLGLQVSRREAYVVSH